MYGRNFTRPKTGKRVTAQRRRIKIDLELPMKDDYSSFIAGLVG